MTESATQTAQLFIEDKHKDILSLESDGLDCRLSYNDQGTANWFREQFPHFPDEYYGVFELYSKGGIRFKEYRNLLKKLDKKGKLKKPTTESIEDTFKKINFNDDKDELLDQPVSLCTAADLSE
jgi:hypothetical protein